MINVIDKKVLILEDNIDTLEALEKMILKLENRITIFKATNVKDAYKIVLESTIDVMIIDVILDTSVRGDVSGLKFVYNVRKVEKYKFTPIIFITSLEDASFYSYRELHCYGYFEKPFDEKAAIKVIKDALYYNSFVSNEKKMIFFRKDGIVYPININEMVFCDSSNHRMRIKTIGEIMEFPYRTCKSILLEADADILIQCSRRTIVNKDFIKSIDPVNRFIELRHNYGLIEIGPTYIKSFIKKMNL